MHAPEGGEHESVSKGGADRADGDNLNKGGNEHEEEWQSGEGS